jgi:hypothetical protein
VPGCSAARAGAATISKIAEIRHVLVIRNSFVTIGLL